MEVRRFGAYGSTQDWCVWKHAGLEARTIVACAMEEQRPYNQYNDF